MADQDQFRHIKIEGYTQRDKYVSPKRGNSPPIKLQDRRVHGSKIREHINRIKEQFDALKDVDLPDGIVRDDAIYVEFISDYNFEPAFDSLNSDAAEPKFQLLNIKREFTGEDFRYRVNVMLTEGGISHFLAKVNEYISENTRYKGEETQTPKNNKLISNIESIQLATLEAFWTEPNENPFPEEDEVVWWEAWFRKKNGIEPASEYDKISSQLALVNAQISDQELIFPEHYVKLVRASPRQLSESLFLLDNLAELRKPKETADFFTNLNIAEAEDAINELETRIENNTDENSIAICILDSGVQNQHPLLSDFIPDNNLFSYKPEDWGTHDGWPRGGHGTGMAGLSLFGDLTHAMSATSNIQIFHRLESVKLINNRDPHDPELYGAVTLEAVNAPIVSAPFRPRIYCMAVTDKDQAYYGRPSSWSASLDKITFGIVDENLEKQLFFVSGGNVFIETPDEFPDKNIDESVHDPAQAFNAITVGAYTEMDFVDCEEFPDSELLSERGGMSPANSTSIIWENDWAVKPDLVMEGGNLANQRGDIVKPDSLQLLTTHKNYRFTPLQTFGDTSAATALASHFAVQLKNEYPDLWPETIRGLMIHSSEWTPTMLGGRNIQDVESFSAEEKRNLLRSYGYGVPSLKKALYSAKNTLTLIAEKEITPFRKDGSIKFNDIHYFELPWPIEVLQGVLSETDVKLNITLSYFIEPNPGSRKYSNKFSYISHGLRFNVIKPYEDAETFHKRINKNTREEGESGFYGESWIIGSRHRDKGSIHRDFWIGSGADLATRNQIAVYPVSGWYRMRKKLEMYDSTVRYSLVVTIEAPEIDVDIYTPVRTLIPIEL
ncbi:S8 family peptidase [Marinoscillum furvescens]|uniref:Subtilase family protein n=1 Tax=Marinoscillum furvescens DSM 4134 TaxID=1122208 RepID=A0A3D9KXT3_MARFU|nr:S8 family peptidase [Marinoscillum furvescens]RED92009.1 subtilase family protein [Marinoscillum furvescens DSM 4134]